MRTGALSARARVDLGGNPIGVDLSLPFLLRARQASSDVPLVRADMRALPFRPGSFRAVLLMFTTFGYFPSDEEDLKVLSDIASILEPEGRFVLDYINAGHLREHLVPTRNAGSCPQVEERRWIDTGGEFLRKESRVAEAGSEEVRVYRERLRLYEPAELDAMLDAARLRVRDRWGTTRAGRSSEPLPAPAPDRRTRGGNRMKLLGWRRPALDMGAGGRDARASLLLEDPERFLA